MANFYWVGGATGTTGAYSTDGLNSASGASGSFSWVRAFDYNNPLNWRILISGLEGTPSAIYGYPNRCPVGLSATTGWGSDTVILCTPYPSGGASGSSGSFGTSYVPKAVTPLLFGGCTSSTLAGMTQPSVTWLAGNTDGVLSAVGGAYINSFDIKTNGLARLSDPNTNYPWSFIGGGLGMPGSTAVPTYSPALEEWAVYNTTGITYNPFASWSKAVNDFYTYASTHYVFGGSARYRELKVKAWNIKGGDESGVAPTLQPGSTNAALDNQGVVNITAVPVFWKNGSGATAIEYAVTTAKLYGTPHYIISGKLLDIQRGGVNNALYSSIIPTAAVAGSFGRPRSHLTVGATVGSVRMPITTAALGIVGTWAISNVSQLGRVEAYPSNKSFLLELDGCGFQRDSVLTSLGLSGATGNPVSNILNENIDVSWMDAVIDSIGNWPGGLVPRKHGVFIGAVADPSARGVTANSVYIGSYRGRGAGITLSVNGNFVANSVGLFNSQFVADSAQPTSRSASVNTLTLWGQSVDNVFGGSLLDFAHQAQFDNWNFGYNVGNQVYGGIVSINEDQGIVRGSQGLRLWNEQLISQFRSSATVRGGAKTAALVELTEPEGFI